MSLNKSTVLATVSAVAGISAVAYYYYRNYGLPGCLQRNIERTLLVNFRSTNELVKYTVNGEDRQEGKSKLLSPESDLYKTLSQYREKLAKKYGDQLDGQRMDFHLELVSKNEDWTEQLVLERAKQLENAPIRVDSVDSFQLGKKSVGVFGPSVAGYGETHAIIGYFPSGLPEDVVETMLSE